MEPLGKTGLNWRNLIRGTGLSLGLRLGGAALGFAFNVLLARATGAEGAGQFFIAFSVSGMVALASRLGLDAIAMRQTARSAAVGDWGEITANGRVALVTAASAGGVASLGLWFASPMVAEIIFHKQSLAPIIRGLALTIVPASLTIILAELLRGVPLLLKSQILQTVIVGMIALPILFFASGAFGVHAAVAAHVAGNIIACFLGLYWWRSATIQTRSKSSDIRVVRGRMWRQRVRGQLDSSVPLFWFGFLTTITGTIDTLMLARFGTAMDVGIYGAAVRLASLTSFIVLAGNSYAGPYYAKAFQTGDILSLRMLGIWSARLNTLIGLPLVSLFWVAPEICLRLFGREFESGAFALAILASVRFIGLAAGPVAQIMIMAGFERSLRNVAICAAVAAIVLNYLLIPLYGAIGAAGATFVAGVVSSLALTIIVRRKIGIWIHAFSRLPE